MLLLLFVSLFESVTSIFLIPYHRGSKKCPPFRANAESPKQNGLDKSYIATSQHFVQLKCNYCLIICVLCHSLVVDPCQQAGGGAGGIGSGIQGTCYCSGAKKLRSQHKPFKICEIKCLNDELLFLDLYY